MAGTVTPYLFYEDVARALDWLRDAFGFEEKLRFADDSGVVSHAEMRIGDGEIMLGAPGGEFKNPKRLGAVTVGVHVYVGDVDAHFERARAAGAEILREPADQEYGDRRYDCADLEGHQWYFATQLEQLAPEEWGATTAAGA